MNLLAPSFKSLTFAEPFHRIDLMLYWQDTDSTLNKDFRST